jgi:tetratricopeptide (TPR) repeat protein
VKGNDFDKALQLSEKGLSLSPNDAELLWLRGKCYSGKLQWANAIQEYNKSISINDRNSDYFIDRGFAFFNDSRNNEALSDFSRALTLNGKAHRAYFGKASVESAMKMNKEAMQDFEKAMMIWPGNQNYKDAFAKAQAAYREKFRENDKPELVLQSPFIRPDGTMVIPITEQAFEIQGLVKDKSQIASIIINDTPADFDAASLNPAFSYRMSPGNYQNITISVSDVFGNVNVVRYPVLRAETEVPRIRVDIPLPKGNVLTISDRKDYKMYLEGQVTDQSLIQSIKVNEVSASFNTKQLNPSFAVSLDVAGVENIQITTKDVNGNANSVNYILNRSSQVEEEINPMGKTWVVFIENSNYQYLPSLEAVSNDIAQVKNSMNGYRIDSIITRKNLSKTEMERFFSIELRNLVNKYDVASLMVWYSGHGKVTSDNGYWLPIDANKKDEYSYFPTTNLKGYLSAYKSVKHTLVVADATETGPAFYLAMRDVSPWKCGDWQATKLKSAQVLSSTEPERKNETSAFSKAFAQTLQSSTDKCVTIDHVSDRVSTAIQRVQKQKPRFGNIQDLGDENGTFFFIKK